MHLSFRSHFINVRCTDGLKLTKNSQVQYSSVSCSRVSISNDQGKSLLSSVISVSGVVLGYWNSSYAGLGSSCGDIDGEDIRGFVVDVCNEISENQLSVLAFLKFFHENSIITHPPVQNVENHFHHFRSVVEIGWVRKGCPVPFAILLDAY